MDYVVGSVAALISGNVTPSRPKLIRRALTPTKHQPSPNVTPKSEFVDDRSIFLSPTLQKKKAIVKKSPKRIFENPELDSTLDESKDVPSPKLDKVKKHLEEQLSTSNSEGLSMVKSPKKRVSMGSERQNDSENTPKKKKKSKTEIEITDLHNEVDVQENPKKKPKKSNETTGKDDIDMNEESKEKKSKKKSKANEDNESENIVSENTEQEQSNNLRKKKIKKKKSAETEEINENAVSTEETTDNASENINTSDLKVKKKKNKKKCTQQEEIIVNPNAITSQDTDSEHESDHEIHSEDENKESLDRGPADSSDGEDEDKPVSKKDKKQKKSETSADVKEKPQPEANEEELKRTLFVGNVLYVPKTKKEIKKLFSEYGHIETVRIRAVPVKDASMSRKVAVIKNELHPERKTVNVYVKFAKPDSVEKALVKNNTVLNGHHLRVTRSDSTGELRDPKCSIFVGNLPFGIEDEALRAKFENCGEIESVRITRDRKTNVGKGFGYVNFKSKDGVELALQLSEEDLTINNRVLRVTRFNYTQGYKKSAEPKNVGASRNSGHNNFKNRNFGNNRQGNSNFGNRQGNFANNRGGQRQFSNNRNPQRQIENNSSQENTGAFRRLANKRKNQNDGEGPPNKQGKKQRKEFVGRTAEKKKKQKFNKGQKKKKVLSEILTKS